MKLCPKPRPLNVNDVGVVPRFKGHVCDARATGRRPGNEATIYPGLGTRYGLVVCAIVISMNRAFKSGPFCSRLDLDYSLWSIVRLWR